MNGGNGIHHLAISTRNIKNQIEFFSDVLGCELVALFWMHGVEGAWHGFVKMNERCYVAFVEIPAIREIETVIGVTHAGNGANPSAGGTMQHLAFNVDSEEELLAMRDRIRSRGITVTGPIDHGMCQSIYFSGPEDLSLEFATSVEAIDGDRWIDPEVVALAGISDQELADYRHPEPLERRATPVPQPPFDPSKPYPRGWSEEDYRAVLQLPDEFVTKHFSEPTPPVEP